MANPEQIELLKLGRQSRDAIPRIFPTRIERKYPETFLGVIERKFDRAMQVVQRTRQAVRVVVDALPGTPAWNKWRQENPDVEVDLSDANLSDTDLILADLRRANLRRANLSGADLLGATLLGADLSDANLSGADLLGVNLSGANLSDADLSGANLSDADLSGADLSDASFGKTTIAKIDLRNTKGLTEIQHQGPSHIELFSIQLPQDDSALYFLRGAGVPDEWINLWRNTTTHPTQYHSLFISFSSKDETLARRLHADLQANGVRCWFALEDLKIGNKFRQRIDEAIHLQDKLLLRGFRPLYLVQD